ncbi:hypothetical protein GCM10023340_04790 [Nocardioides marinquilinus]|uniref:Uncharacterized protein n=1 Tax=Nocardioides marinquilinus TaxID=1210400 RepID=A0ABP9P7C5_9ACTN
MSTGAAGLMPASVAASCTRSAADGATAITMLGTADGVADAAGSDEAAGPTGTRDGSAAPVASRCTVIAGLAGR